jgi:PAS domain-containing protein
MVDSDQSNEETKQLQASVLKTATSVLQIRQRAEQEIRRTNEVLEARTRELAQALEIVRATLESTTDSIMVTDEKGKITNFNQQYIEMWKIPPEILEGGIAREVRKFASQSFADPRHRGNRCHQSENL